MKLRVRMYRQGLGDCFLLTYSDASDESHLLIDCGVLKGTAEPEKKMQAVAQNVHEATNGHLDRLVVTHEHWDHLSGFLQAQTIFDTVEVGEVWLAWTEDPDDELAAELRKHKKKALDGIVAAAKLADKGKTPAAQRTARQLDALLNFQGDLGATGTKTPAKALDWVKGRAPQPEYLRPGEQLFDLPGLPGLRIYVWGHRMIAPDQAQRSQQEDPEVYELVGAEGSHEGFLAAAEALADAGTPETQPFDDYFRIEEAQARARTGS